MTVETTGSEPAEHPPWATAATTARESGWAAKAGINRQFRWPGNGISRDSRQDNVLDIRQFQMAFRKLRQYSSRVDGSAKTELDIDQTIDKTCDNAGLLSLVYDKTEEKYGQAAAAHRFRRVHAPLQPPLQPALSGR